MKYVIQKGHHRASPPAFGIFWDKKNIERVVSFGISAKYELSASDQGDVNKLFGIGYFPNHHKESARFGWNYNRGTNKINLFAYCYVNGERIIEHLCEVPKNKVVLLFINIINNVYSFSVVDTINTWHKYGGYDVPFTHTKKLSYRLGCYFGGNKTAPHDIEIEIKRK